MIRDIAQKAKVFEPGLIKDSAEGAMNLARVAGYIGLYLGNALVGKTVIKDPKTRLAYYIQNVSKYSRDALKAMNFDIEVIGYDRKLMAERPLLMVSNHMSYVDILVMSSIQPSVFVTSVDMGEVFFLGTMAEMGGSIFVERRHRGQINQDVSVIANTLRDGFHVMIYPEGTSGNGQQILPFKKSLLMAAVEAKCDILPVCLKYTEINGKPFGPENADLVCWYGDMSFAPHFAKLASLKNVKVELHFLEPIRVSEESTRHELADRCYDAINSVYASESSALSASSTAKDSIQGN